MDRRIFGMFVLSGLCCFSFTLHPRQFHLINTPKNWNDAWKYCRDKHGDLATVNDEQELAELAALVENNAPYVFLGLHRVWGWSRSEGDDYKEGEPAYWNWAAGEPGGSHHCGSMSEAGEWFATDCSSSLNFFCYNGFEADLSQRFILASGSMDWASAQDHCRNLYTGLARVRNQEDNELLQKMVNQQRVWIGMTRTTWTWSDGSEASFVPWNHPPSSAGHCGALDVKNLGMTDRSCSEKHPFICYSAPLRKHLVRLKLASSDSVDMNDLTVMESILTGVGRKLGGVHVKVSWNKPPEKMYPIKEEHCGPEIIHVF